MPGPQDRVQSGALPCRAIPAMDGAANHGVLQQLLTPWAQFSLPCIPSSSNFLPQKFHKSLCKQQGAGAGKERGQEHSARPQLLHGHCGCGAAPSKAASSPARSEVRVPGRGWAQARGLIWVSHGWGCRCSCSSPECHT